MVAFPAQLQVGREPGPDSDSGGVGPGPTVTHGDRIGQAPSRIRKRDTVADTDHRDSEETLLPGQYALTR